MNKLFFFATATALTISSAFAADSYRVKLFQPSVIGGQELKPGEYKMEIVNDKAVLKSGKTVVEANVKVREDEQKADATTVRYDNANGKYKVTEIRLGGTKTKVMFEAGNAAAGGN
jgi:lipopolysaccharide export system protein LptA